MSSAEVYPLALTKRLLEHVRCCLELGRWPGEHGDYDREREDLGPGFRGHRPQPVAGFEAPIEALVDLEAAVEDLSGEHPALAGAVRAHYWEGRRVAWRWSELVDAVWAALNDRPIRAPARRAVTRRSVAS